MWPGSGSREDTLVRSTILPAKGSSRPSPKSVPVLVSKLVRDRALPHQAALVVKLISNHRSHKEFVRSRASSMCSRKRSDSQTTTGSVVEVSREKKEKEGKKKGTWSIWGRNDSKKDRVPLTQTAQPTQTVKKLSIRYATWATTRRMRQAVARTGRHMLFHVQRRRPDRLQPPVPHLYWLLQPCHGSPGGRSSQGVPGWFVEPTEHRHAFHSFGPNIYPNHDLFFLGLTRSSANFSVLSHVL